MPTSGVNGGHEQCTVYACMMLFTHTIHTDSELKRSSLRAWAALLTILDSGVRSRGRGGGEEEERRGGSGGERRRLVEERGG